MVVGFVLSFVGCGDLHWDRPLLNHDSKNDDKRSYFAAVVVVEVVVVVAVGVPGIAG